MRKYYLTSLAWFIVLGAIAQDIKKLKLEQYLDIENVSDPQISPNGQEILYTRTWVDKVNDKRESDIWVMDVNGGRNRLLLKGSNPRWSPDGSRILFTASGQPKGSQIFVKYKDTEGATQITRESKSPANMTWSPDGRFIGFTMQVPAKNPWPVKIPGKPEGAKWTEEPKFVSSLVYRRDRVGF